MDGEFVVRVRQDIALLRTDHTLHVEAGHETEDRGETYGIENPV